MYNLTEDQIFNIVHGSGYPVDGINDKLSSILNGYFARYIDDLEPFLINDDGSFNINRAIRRINMLSDSIKPHDKYYCGAQGWRNRPANNHSNGYYLSYSRSSNRRVGTYDAIFNLAHTASKVPELLDAVTTETSMVTNSKCGIIGWIVENDYHKNEKVIDTFLRGFFQGELKVQIMKELIEDKEFSKLEVFWKSRALKVKKLLINNAPLEELPFRLDTKNKAILALIEKKLESKK
jgi:hypothetical protein